MAFGSSIKTVISEARQKPAYGAINDTTNLLLSMLENKE
jgi:hypothetical protein